MSSLAKLLELIKQYGPVVLQIIALLSAAKSADAAASSAEVTADDVRAECAKQNCDPCEVEAAIKACECPE